MPILSTLQPCIYFFLPPASYQGNTLLTKSTQNQETVVGSLPTTDSATIKAFLKVHKGLLPNTTLVQFGRPSYVATSYGNSIADVGFGIPREIMSADPWNDKKIAFRYWVYIFNIVY